MYNKRLDAFLAVTESGSFSKAADQLHISPPALLKQINALEDEIDVQLFRRTHRGVELTEAGQAFQEDSRKLIQMSRDAIRRAQQIGAGSSQQVRLGTSLLRSARFFLNLWSNQYGKSLIHRVHITPFLDNSFGDYLKTVGQLGKEIDVIATAYHPELSGYECNALEITKLPFCCAVPAEHPLAEKEILEPGDLRGESILILRKGLSSSVDEARAELGKISDITLVDTPDYEPSTFNRCEATNQLLLTLECWANAHPMLKTIPINWSLGAPYGLLYSKTPSKDTQSFIDFIRRNITPDL